ncbi:MAG: acetate--CoA ligase family protein [Hyphomicrobiaceae bacterium]
MSTAGMASQRTGAGTGRPGHRLDPLLAPASIALLGASARPESAGLALVKMVRFDGYEGRVHPVNPNYREIEGLPAFARLKDLPEPVEHAVLAVPNAGLEAALEEAIASGVGAVTIFANCHLDDDREPRLAERIRARAAAAGIAVCGANCMGFYNPYLGLRVASFPAERGLRKGGIAWIAQSGSAFSALSHNDRRLGFSLVVSAGMELVTGVADYMDWALEREETRVVGLFLETVRRPADFIEALARAAARDVPVVALKVGRTAASAAMAATHTGALAGNDAAYRALFDRYGVRLVEDLDEMAATLSLLDCGRRVGRGGLATMHDSGGERELLTDLAEGEGVPFGRILEATKARIVPELDPGLVAENPLDAYGTNRDYAARYARAMAALIDDPDVALGVFMSNPRDDYWYSAGIAAALKQAAAGSAKPVALGTNYTLTHDEALAVSLAEAGIPLIKGTRNVLKAVGHALAIRDFRERPAIATAAPPAGVRGRWQARLAAGTPLGEHEALALAADYGIAVPRSARVRERAELSSAAGDLAFPLVLKTDEGHAHKSDVGGVVLGLADAAALAAAYDDMAARLGPKVLVMEMAGRGVEIGLGAVVDPSFGPIVMVSAGGVMIEIMDDKAVALAPFDEREALRLIGRLKVSRLLEGVRGARPAERMALARLVARFSVMAADLSGLVAEIDLNPVIAGPAGAVAVDALIVPKSAAN